MVQEIAGILQMYNPSKRLKRMLFAEPQPNWHIDLDTIPAEQEKMMIASQVVLRIDRVGLASHPVC